MQEHADFLLASHRREVESNYTRNLKRCKLEESAWLHIDGVEPLQVIYGKTGLSFSPHEERNPQTHARWTCGSYKMSRMCKSRVLVAHNVEVYSRTPHSMQTLPWEEFNTTKRNFSAINTTWETIPSHRYWYLWAERPENSCFVKYLIFNISKYIFKYILL